MGNTDKNKEPANESISRYVGEGNPNALYSDEQLVQEILTAIRKEGSVAESSKEIEVASENGVVTLKGDVCSEREKMTLGDKAVSFAGFGKVVNELHILEK